MVGEEYIGNEDSGEEPTIPEETLRRSMRVRKTFLRFRHLATAANDDAATLYEAVVRLRQEAAAENGKGKGEVQSRKWRLNENRPAFWRDRDFV